jgi:hypothetical protein
MERQTDVLNKKLPSWEARERKLLENIVSEYDQMVMMKGLPKN